jgi:GTP-binding protein EngB required for normal cell division
VPVPESRLNENQQRHLLSSCQYIDKLLGEMQAILASGETGSPFEKYAADGPPAQQKVVLDFIARLRREVIRALESEGLHPSPPRIPATFALRTHLSFIDVAVEELKPTHMRGYGELTPPAATRLGVLVAELQATLGKLDEHLARGRSGDLTTRLERLEAAGRDVRVMRLLGDIVQRHGLTEFRPALDLLADRYEDRHFEIAVFGRVSTGKSSLLNHLLQVDVLPVGVNPITAIPTRLVHGPALRVSVDFLTGAHEDVDPVRLAEFVSEEENPGNTRRVSRVTVAVPSPRLREGIVFVDTPGLGSLATSGAAETLAYLPRCDLAMVLVDAAGSLTPEDVSTIRALLDAGTPVLLLLSKADLLAADDVARASRYIEDHVIRQLGLALPVTPVSVAPSFASRLEDWFRQQVVPVLDRHEEARRQSLARKTGALRETLIAALERIVARAGHGPRPQADDTAVLDRLKQAAAAFDGARIDAEAILDDIPPRWTAVLERAAETLLSGGVRDLDAAAADTLVRGSLDEVLGEPTQQLLARLRALIETARDAVPTVDRGPDSLDPSRLLREVPRPDLGQLHLRTRPGAVRLLGVRATRNAVQRLLDEQAGSEIQAAVGSYAALLRKWFLRTLRLVRSDFEVLADAQRARTSVGTGMGGDVNGPAVGADLERLRASGGSYEPRDPISVSGPARG